MKLAKWIQVTRALPTEGEDHRITEYSAEDVEETQLKYERGTTGENTSISQIISVPKTTQQPVACSAPAVCWYLTPRTKGKAREVLF